MGKCFNTPMQPQTEHAASRWTLPVLVDFEARLTRTGDMAEVDRRFFVHSIRPRLAEIDDDRQRRRIGLRLWLGHERGESSLTVGRVFGQALGLAGWGMFLLLALSGMGLASGLLLGPRQA